MAMGVISTGRFPTEHPHPKKWMMTGDIPKPAMVCMVFVPPLVLLEVDTMRDEWNWISILLKVYIFGAILGLDFETRRFGRNFERSSSGCSSGIHRSTDAAVHDLSHHAQHLPSMARLSKSHREW